ncbi:MAG: efflux RND transporter permease subunit [Candidatus Eisenbacteria bacterium]
MTRFFVRHPVSTWMVFLAFVVLGIYSFFHLSVEAIPDVSLPRLSIVTSWNGASPQAIQRSITLPIEEAARQVHGVESVVSRSRSGQSVVEVEFRRNVDIDFARLEMNEQLGGVRRDLPQGAGQPQVQAFVPEEFQTEQFFTVNLESPLSTNELRERAEIWVLPRILAVEGVADARIQGGARPLLKVELDRRLLDLYGIEADEIFQALEQLDDLSGAGVIARSGLEFTVSLRSPVDRLGLERAAVARSGGRTFRLDELAVVTSSFEDPQYFVRANGQNVVQIAVEKRSGSNSVSVSQSLRRELPKIEADLPFDVSFYVDSDEGRDLEEKLEELILRSLAILGLLFLLLALSLREFRLTAIVVASILFAIVISLSLFYFFKISVNFITISGLTVCFGLILDNSILVVDAISRRVETWKRTGSHGLSRAAKLQVAAEAVVGGTREVTFPIMATTLTTVVAFVSFIFLSGRLSLYYVPLAISVTMAMAASLFVAFGWLPVVLNQRWAGSLARREEDGDREIAPEEVAHLVDEMPDLSTPPRGLERFFYGLQRAWWILVPVLLGLLVWSGYLYDKKVIKGGFWQMPSQEELFLYMRLPEGTDVQVTSETLALFEEPLLPIPEGARMQTQAFGYQGFIRITFDDELLASPYPLLYRELLTEQADKTGGSGIFIRGFSSQPYMKGTFGGAGLNSLIKITGYNSKTLMEIADNTLARVDRNRRVRNARITTSSGFRSSDQEEAVIRLRRDKLAEHDLGVVQVVGHIRRMLGVDTPWRMFVDGEREQIQLIYEDSESIQYGDLADRVILSPTGEKVRIGDLVSIDLELSPGDITRDNQRYSVQVNWEFVGTERMRSAYLKDILAGIELPYGYTAEESERQFFTPEEEEELTLMVVLAAVFIFMILAALFESASLPILVMLSLPMALVGVVVLFWLTSSDFDSSARIGLVLLFGIVVNNAILLVSRFRHEAESILRLKLGGEPAVSRSLLPGLRKQLGGSDLGVFPPSERVDLLRRAVARGTRIKLRSILLTTGTTLVGLLPLLLFRDETEGRDIWVNLALSSTGGLASSLVLILLMVPVLYTMFVRLGWDARVMNGVRVGTVFGIAIGAFEAWRQITGSFQGEWPSDLAMPVFVLGLILALAIHRSLSNSVRFGDGWIVGLCYTGMAAALQLGIVRGALQLLDEETLETIAERTKNLFEQLTSSHAWMEKLIVPETVALLIAGTLLSLLLAAFFQKRGAVPSGDLGETSPQLGSPSGPSA